MAPEPDRNGTDDTLMRALACGATVAVAARQAGLSERTAYRRLAEPGFRRGVNRLRADMHERAMGGFVAASLESVKTLVNLQRSDMPPAVRLGAAKAALNYGLRLRQVVELEGRLEAIEEQLADRQRT